MGEKKVISIRGAREHNLKNISLDIPRNKFVVMTGLSGSGKSSLAFDTIYAEGQRRYMQSLSSYARQFLGQMDKPDVDSIEGLSPAISIDQKSTNHNPRSTVGTVTEIYDYLRLLYARCGTPHCPKCGKPISRQSVDEMADRIMELEEGTRITLLSPVVRGRKGEHAKVIRQAKKAGFVRVRVDGSIYDLSEEIRPDKNLRHTIEIVVDRLVVKEGIGKRLTDSIETALSLSDGLLTVDVRDGGVLNFSRSLSCPDCGVSIEEIEPRSFSFNNPYGACPACSGLGAMTKFDMDLIIPDRSKSISQGAIDAFGWRSSSKEGSYSYALLEGMAEFFGFSLDTPYGEYPDKVRDFIEHGTGGRRFPVRYVSDRGDNTWNVSFEGILNNMERRYNETSNGAKKAEYELYMRQIPCAVCGGRRLKPESLAVTVGDLNIYELTRLPLPKAREFLFNLKLSDMKAVIAGPILKEVYSRLDFLIEVGLEYLTLSRPAGSLSGGESQRIRLATQIGSGLVGVAYILDEPSIGLHQRDNGRLLGTLKQLRDLGNTVIVVEHDEETMRKADWIVDIGPGAGESGGHVTAQGTIDDIMAAEDSITGDYLAGRRHINIPQERRTPGGFIKITGACENNLKNIDVSIPLGVFTCVTGVSGSGKSTLINEILYKSLAKGLYGSRAIPGAHRGISGGGLVDKVIQIDQSPIGRTPRSNPATYTGAFDHIREIFAATPEARTRGYGKGRFSFNVRGGRCEACSGDGIIKIEMNFLPDVYVPCDVCGGRRYSRETLEVKYKGRNIHDVLEMTVGEALDFFSALPPLKRKIEMLHYVGLSYIRLGQPSTQLSGGEAQRVKLAAELCKRPTGKTMYILDEPTTGLHFEDVSKLVAILRRLSSGGNSVVTIEHNLDVIKTADYIIDMGPEGGDGGGRVVAEGTPEQVAKVKGSYTGRYIKKILEKQHSAEVSQRG